MVHKCDNLDVVASRVAAAQCWENAAGIAADIIGCCAWCEVPSCMLLGLLGGFLRSRHKGISDQAKVERQGEGTSWRKAKKMKKNRPDGGPASNLREGWRVASASREREEEAGASKTGMEKEPRPLLH
mmetsp:Transcript_14102/g.21286  ORF Transcript_14102/g.21286 Transcript_14102/m.21286 type:complete len:128 (+) Transcript_14102:79-462(+)